VELCDGGVCQRFPVDSLCGEDMGSSAMQILLSAPVAVCGGCFPTKDGPWPTCLASDDFAACMTEHCNIERGPNDSCTSLCTAAHQARSFYSCALVGTIVTMFLIWASFWYGWCKHSGTLAAFFAMLAAIAVPVSLIILAGADVASVIQTTSSLKRTTDWTPTAAIVEAIFITLILATESFLVIGVAKSQRAMKYSPLNGGVECCPFFFKGHQDEEVGRASHEASEDEESPNPKVPYEPISVAPKPGRSTSVADELERALDQATGKQQEDSNDGAGLGIGSSHPAPTSGGGGGGGSWASPPDAKENVSSGGGGSHVYKDTPAAVSPDPGEKAEEAQKPPEEPPRKPSPEPATIGAPTFLQATAPAPRQTSKNSLMSRFRGQSKSKEPAPIVVEPAAPAEAASSGGDATAAAKELEAQLDAYEGKDSAPGLEAPLQEAVAAAPQEAPAPSPPSRQDSKVSKDSKQRGGSKASRVVPETEDRAPSHASNAWQEQAIAPLPPKKEDQEEEAEKTVDTHKEPDTSGQPEPGGLLGGLEEALASRDEQRRKEQEEEDAWAAAEAKSAAEALAAAEAAAAAEAEAAAKAKAEAEAAAAAAAAAAEAAEAAEREARERQAKREREEREERERKARAEKEQKDREEREREAARLEQEEREKRQREEEQRLAEEQERERELERQRIEKEREERERQEWERQERERKDREEREQREREELKRQERERQERERALQTPSPAPPAEPENAWQAPVAPMVVIQSSNNEGSPEAYSPPSAAPSPPSPSESQAVESLGEFLHAPASPSGRGLLSPPGAGIAGQTGGNDDEGSFAPTLSIDTSGSRSGLPPSPRNRPTPKAKAVPKDVVFLSAPLAAALRMGAFSSGSSSAAKPKMGPESSSPETPVSTSVNANRMLASGSFSRDESSMAPSSSANGPKAGRKAPPVAAQGREMDSSLNKLMNSFHLDPVGSAGSTANSRSNSKLGPPPAAAPRVNSLPMSQPRSKASGSALSPASVTAAAAASLQGGSNPTRLGSAGQSTLSRNPGAASLSPSPSGSFIGGSERQASKNSAMEANPSTASKKPGGAAQPMLFF